MKVENQKGFINLKQMILLTKRNYFITAIALCVLFVGMVSVYKLFFSKPTYVYVKVKMGQGLWWANTQRPSAWFLKAVKQVKEETDLTGQPIVKVLDITYYPWYASGQYDVYLNVALKVSRLGKTGKYNFKRFPIGVGTPIDFEFPEAQFSGTIIDLSENPFSDVYVTKTVTITKKGAYPWEYDAIKVGDSYFNGETKTLEILNKESVDTSSIFTDTFGNNMPLAEESKKYIVIKLLLKGRITDNQFVYSEDQVVTPGKAISVGVPDFAFNDFTVAKVE